LSFRKKSALAAASTSLFVLLWSSGAIFSKWGLAHASPFAFLMFRFVIALCGLVLLVPLLKLKLPKGGKPMLYAMATGVVLLGAYQIFFCWPWTLKSRPG
jgi:drug/metabolite transporter (DMT)-like permease